MTVFFFTDKILTIKQCPLRGNIVISSVPSHTPAKFEHFCLPDYATLTETVHHLRPTPCFDTLPTHCFLKNVFTSLAPDAIQFVNSSLQSGLFEGALKNAVIKPLLKKYNLDVSVISNSRPISNLPIL